MFSSSQKQMQTWSSLLSRALIDSLTWFEFLLVFLGRLEGRRWDVLSMDTHNQWINTAEWPGIATSGLVALHQYGMMLRDTGSHAQLHQVPQFHWAWLLYTCITIRILTYLLFLVTCVDGILQTDSLKNQAQCKHRVKAFLFPKCSLSK